MGVSTNSHSFYSLYCLELINTLTLKWHIKITFINSFYHQNHISLALFVVLCCGWRHCKGGWASNGVLIQWHICCDSVRQSHHSPSSSFMNWPMVLLVFTKIYWLKRPPSPKQRPQTQFDHRGSYTKLLRRS